MADKINKLKIEGKEVRVNLAEEYSGVDGDGKATGISRGTIAGALDGKLDKVIGTTTKDQMYVKRANGTNEMADIPAAAVIDDVMSDTSTNAVQNKIIKGYVDTEVGKKVTKATILPTGSEQFIYGYNKDGEKSLQLGAANGVASLDGAGKVPLAQIPDAILGQLTFGGTVEQKNVESADRILAYLSNDAKTKIEITADTIQIVNSGTDEPSAIPYPKYGYGTLEKIYFICRNSFTVASTTFNIGDWLIGAGSYWDIIKNTDAVTGVKGEAETDYRIGNINITKANIGLGNVDNTSDANKPVSTATQTALNAKQATIEAGTAGNIISYSGTPGSVGSLEKVASVVSTATDSQIPSAKAVYDYHDANKQDKVVAGTANDIMAFSGTAGSINSLSRVSEITTAANDGQIPTAAAVKAWHDATKQDTLSGTNQLDADYIKDGTTNKVYTATEQTKLSGVLAEGFTTAANKKYMVVVETDASNNATKRVIEYSFE